MIFLSNFYSCSLKTLKINKERRKEGRKEGKKERKKERKKEIKKERKKERKSNKNKSMFLALIYFSNNTIIERKCAFVCVCV